MDMEWNKECAYCKKEFEKFEDVIECQDNLYHKDCVSLYPISYAVYIGGEFLGETENEDGSCVSDYIWEDDENEED